MPTAVLWLVKHWKPVLLVCLVGAAALSAYLYLGAREDRAVAEDRLAQSEADNQAKSEQIDRIRANAATAAVIAETLNRGVQDALTDNPDWSTQRTPAAVTERLCEYIRCTESSD